MQTGILVRHMKYVSPPITCNDIEGTAGHFLESNRAFEKSLMFLLV